MANLRKGGFTFHGSYTSKILAARKEREIPGSFVIERNGRYYVLKEKRVGSKPVSNVRSKDKTFTEKEYRAWLKQHKIPVTGKYRRIAKKKAQSNPRGTLIYQKITRVEGTKGAGSHFAGQRFFHNFKKPYPKMFGLPNGDLLITSRK